MSDRFFDVEKHIREHGAVATLDYLIKSTEEQLNKDIEIILLSKFIDHSRCCTSGWNVYPELGCSCGFDKLKELRNTRPNTKENENDAQ